MVHHAAQEKITRELLDRLEQPLDPSALVRDLRIGQQQIVEIAKALSHNVRVLIMDEPTSALTASETEALFRIIADLKADGVAIIYISHKMEELLTIGDYVTILRDGKLAASAPASTVNIAWIVEKMVGRNVIAPRHRTQTVSDGERETVLEIKDLSLPRIGGGSLSKTLVLSFSVGRFWRFSVSWELAERNSSNVSWGCTRKRLARSRCQTERFDRRR